MQIGKARETKLLREARECRGGHARQPGKPDDGVDRHILGVVQEELRDLGMAAAQGALACDEGSDQPVIVADRGRAGGQGHGGVP